ncbi:MAG: element excision factor XisH family protein [Chloroflexota bacterium]
MPAKDIYHKPFRKALKKDGWKITHDPMRLLWEQKSLFVDMGAEPIIAAEKEHQKIAIEIKTFQNPDDVYSIHNAAGQYVFYRSILRRLQPDRILYLAIPIQAFQSLFDEGRVGEVLLRDEGIRVIIFDPVKKEILRWLEP